MTYCNDFIHKRCFRENCKFEHDDKICFHYWVNNRCKFGDECKFKHIKNKKNKHKKNTETFKPINKNDVDMRIIFNDASRNVYYDNDITSKDVIVVKYLFDDYSNGEIYNMLINEIHNCGINIDELLKLWHGDTHLIADDKLEWKKQCPTFSMVIDRIKHYFNIDIQSTRFNWYKDTSQFKSYHFDAAAIKPHIAKIQNTTIAVSFGATREASFERDTKDKIRIKTPINDGDIYVFTNKTNELWRHGILQELEVKKEGRISIIAWGWIDDIIDV